VLACVASVGLGFGLLVMKKRFLNQSMKLHDVVDSDNRPIGLYLPSYSPDLCLRVVRLNLFDFV